jgi:hypothetical protein
LGEILFEFESLIGGLPAGAVVIVGYAAIVVAFGVVCEALGADEEKVFGAPVRKILRTLGAASKAAGGLAAVGAAAYALGAAEELQPFGWGVAGGLVALVAFGYVFIAWLGSRSGEQNSGTPQAAAGSSQSPLDCPICGHSVATIHTITT